VAQVVEPQICNTQEMAGPSKRRPDALGVVRENELVRAWLGLHDRPGARRIFEAPMVSFLGRWMLGIAHHAGLVGPIVVLPLEAADLGFATGGRQRKFHDTEHGDLRTLVAPSELVAETREFIRRRAPSAFAGLPGEAKFRLCLVCLLLDLRAHRKLPDVLGGPQDDPEPYQVICEGGGSCAFGAP
jgi:hypothetical protein